MKPRIYLAGPDVFRRDAKCAGKRLKTICGEFGLCGLYPLDGEPIDLSRPNASKLIYNANVNKLRAADAIVANITPFRGPHMDPGTAFEIGYARHAGLPVFFTAPIRGNCFNASRVCRKRYGASGVAIAVSRSRISASPKT